MIIRRPASDREEVAIVHRPRYDDWSLPKGKLEPGESWDAAALREVREETGFECRLGEELGTARYRDSKGRPKTVRYWVMEPVEGSFEPGREVDELRWVGPAEAAELLTYDRDRQLVAEAVNRPPSGIPPSPA